MRVARLPILWFTASLVLGGAGCEIASQVDRNQIGDTTSSTGSGSGGEGGIGATATSSVASTSGGLGGAGGGATSSTGAGGAGGAGGGGATSSSASTGGGAGGAGGGATSSSASSSASTGAGGAGGGGGATSSTAASSSSGQGGGATSSSASSSASTGGGGAPCTTANDCPQATGECVTPACTAGLCGTANVAAGKPTATQTAGDCKQNECDGNGAVITANNDADTKDDSNPCTVDACSGGVATHLPAMMGLVCGAGQVCDAVGDCVGCLAATTCPGADTECQTRTCTVGVCGVANAAAGTPTATQTAGDCKQNECDGAGAIVAANHDADLPSDGFQCTSDVCAAGVPSNPPLAAGAVCTQNSGTMCDGAGACVSAGVGHLVINEVDYDQVNADNGEFVEIYNGTSAPVALAGYSLVLVNGNGNVTYLVLSLASAGTLPAGGYLVVGTTTLLATVPAGTLKIPFALATDNIQNGAPDGVALVNTTTSTLVDALSYEGAMTSVTVTGVPGMVSLVEGTLLPATTADSNTVVGSLSRLPNGTDLNNAATDWAFTATPTPGAANQ